MIEGKFDNKYRIASARAHWWNYGICAQYFITICTRNKEYFFGDIENCKIKLSPVGAIADVLWNNIPIHFQNVELGPYVVMPNHLHGILILTNQNTDQNNASNVETLHATSPNNESISPVETLHATSLKNEPYNPEQTLHATSLQNEPINHEQTLHATSLHTDTGRLDYSDISPKPKTVSTIVRSYKSAVTKHCNRLGLENGWQPRFYDRIIRKNDDYHRISHYIINNPESWINDELNNINL